MLTLIQVHAYQVLAYLKYDILDEIREIVAIRRVQDYFREGKDIEETLEIESETVEIIVYGHEATIYINDITIELIYDDVFMCIEDINIIE